MGELLQHANKKKRPTKKEAITMRGIAGDWGATDGPADIGSSSSKKSDKKAAESLDYPSRPAFPSDIQVRSAVLSILVIL